MPGNEHRGAGPAAQVVLDTTDPECAEAHLASVYGGAMKASRGSSDYRFRHVRLGAGPFHLDTIEDALTSQYHAEPLPALTVVRIHRGIRTDLATGERFGPGDLTVHAQPGDSSDTRLASVLESVVHVPLRAVAEAAGNRPDEDLGRLRFATLRPVSPAAARDWLRTVDLIATSLVTNPDGMSQPLVAGAASRLLAASLLTNFANNWTAQPHPADRTDASPATLSRAVAFIDTNADLDISAVDIARAARASVRAVQLAFRRHRGTTPTAYLRRVRLEQARRELLGATAGDGTTVAGVAARWGYASPRRFADRYRQIYGEPPSHTLRG